MRSPTEVNHEHTLNWALGDMLAGFKTSRVLFHLAVEAEETCLKMFRHLKRRNIDPAENSVFSRQRKLALELRMLAITFSDIGD